MTTEKEDRVSMATVEERVAAGAKWLDEQKPGWWEIVTINELSMQSPCACVLGQVFKDEASQALDSDGYTYVYDHFAKTDGEEERAQQRWVEAHGFDATKNRSGEDGRSQMFDDYQNLQAAWRAVIKDRKENASA